MIRFFLGLTLLIVLSIFVIPALLVFTGIPVGVVYVVPFALLFAYMIERFSGSKPRKRDELAKRFGVWVAEWISNTFDLQPRPEPTRKERLIAAAVGTAAVIGLWVVAYLSQAAPSWYGIIFGLWLIAMLTAWAVRRPNLQQPNDAE
ncbi:hypothetical protein KX729_33335 [Rhizobium sp. XQZ8]|uniref:hypothetical protein n=1 Tax=Rhizobium populisoli TaxID=2859785 RepID=UPI001CA4D115|nr:hypothetical protein [Rhizobium populisoli]MBW6426222.1 hypothetical protein [Rhizobium populisoli]